MTIEQRGDAQKNAERKLQRSATGGKRRLGGGRYGMVEAHLAAAAHLPEPGEMIWWRQETCDE